MKRRDILKGLVAAAAALGAGAAKGATFINSFWMAAIGIGGSNALFNATNTTSNSTSSASFVDVTLSGVPVTISFTKVSASTEVLIFAAMNARYPGTSPTQISIGVNDGTTDYEVFATGGGGNSTTVQTTVTGHKSLTGLAAGAYTFTLRMRSDGTNSWECSAGGSITLRALEVDAT